MHEVDIHPGAIDDGKLKGRVMTVFKQDAEAYVRGLRGDDMVS